VGLQDARATARVVSWVLSPISEISIALKAAPQAPALASSLPRRQREDAEEHEQSPSRCPKRPGVARHEAGRSGGEEDWDRVRQEVGCG